MVDWLMIIRHFTHIHTLPLCLNIDFVINRKRLRRAEKTRRVNKCVLCVREEFDDDGTATSRSFPLSGMSFWCSIIWTSNVVLTLNELLPLLRHLHSVRWIMTFSRHVEHWQPSIGSASSERRGVIAQQVVRGNENFIVTSFPFLTFIAARLTHILHTPVCCRDCHSTFRRTHNPVWSLA